VPRILLTKTISNWQVIANLDEALKFKVLHVFFPAPPSLNSLDSQPCRERRKTKPAHHAMYYHGRSQHSHNQTHHKLQTNKKNKPAREREPTFKPTRVK
jgi:hypothetical protein